MPSFRAVFVLATAAFATLSSAVPVAPAGLPSLATLPKLPVGLPTFPRGLPAVPGLSTLPGMSGLPDVTKVTDLVSGVKGRDNDVDITAIEFEERDTLQSLPEILEGAHTKLTAISEKLVTVCDGKVIVDVEVVIPIIREVEEVVFEALTLVKAIVGHPKEFVLTLAGKVLSIPEVARLLCTVLTLICSILTIALRVVGAVKASVVVPAIAAVGAVLCELLHCVFGLVAGLLAAVVPIAGALIQILLGLSLGNVVAILKV